MLCGKILAIFAKRDNNNNKKRQLQMQENLGNSTESVLYSLTADWNCLKCNLYFAIQILVLISTIFCIRCYPLFHLSTRLLKLK